MTIFQQIKFSELLEEYVRVGLKKGLSYSFVPMENVEAGKKYPRYIERKKFTGGGSKFADDDTLFARITPCLQNKKIAKVKNLENGVGFGSTEFFIFRAKKGITNPDYLYYTLKQEDLINTAILSMVGASGRQRADIRSILDYNVSVPNLSTQTHIASVLSAYDDLVENNEKRIKILEEMVQLLYTEWFVKTVKSDLPRDWEIVTIGSLLEKVKRKAKLQAGEYLKSGEFPIVDQGREFIAGYTNDKDTVYRQDLIVFGDHSRCFKYVNFPFACGADGTQLLLTNDFERMPEILLYYVVLNSGLQNFNYARHFKFLKALRVIKPDSLVAKKFAVFANNIYSQVRALRDKNKILTKTRDLLIPQLVTGKRKLKNI